MYDYDNEIRKLSNQFYNEYPRAQYPEMLVKQQRSYDIVIFEVEFISNCYIAVPFRTEMNHNNGYRFRFSKRSSQGLDYSKMLIIKDECYIDSPATVDLDEYVEFIKNKDKIHKGIEKYILDYINHINGNKVLHL